MLGLGAQHGGIVELSEMCVTVCSRLFLYLLTVLSEGSYMYMHMRVTAFASFYTLIR